MNDICAASVTNISRMPIHCRQDEIASRHNANGIDFNIRLTTYNPLPLELSSYPILYPVFSLHLPYPLRSLRFPLNFDILDIVSLQMKIIEKTDIPG